MPATNRPTSATAPRTVLITACSALFYDHYVDLLDSLAALDLKPACDIGVIDLGLTAAQRDALGERNVRCVPATWPVKAPEGHDRIEYIAFAGKPFARDFFPGYDLYVWMDADMWAQTADFWNHLTEGAMRAGFAVPVEHDVNYEAMPAILRLWMMRHFTRAFGVTNVLKMMKRPVLNNGLFAARADAPHWDAWQNRFERMVAKTRRMIAIDQLALIGMFEIDRLPCALLDATDNWVCSLATPWWDPVRALFVRPDQPGTPISVMHLTTPSRDRTFEIPTTTGQTERLYLYRPGGRVLESMQSAALEKAELANSAPDKAPANNAAATASGSGKPALGPARGSASDLASDR